MEVITYNNKVYYIKKYDNESNSMFWDRAWFVVKYANNYNDLKFYQIINYSKLWAYNKYYNCIYNNDVTEKIKQMELSLYFNPC
jgi:hypothetical protein